MKQITSRIPDILYDEISNIADDLDRSVSYTISLLLQQAVKEKNRKRRGNKENNTENYPADMGTRDSQ